MILSATGQASEDYLKAKEQRCLVKLKTFLKELDEEGCIINPHFDLSIFGVVPTNFDIIAKERIQKNG